MKHTSFTLSTKLILQFFLVLVSVLFVQQFTQTANAAPVTGFNAGLIIDDGVFTNKDSMSVSEIQQFLVSKVPVCKTNGVPGHSYSQTTFTCLKDYSENGKGSAQIIYDTAQNYSINPQVLMVLLQKEQSLITDSWPLDSQYRSATGYGCPDTAVCNSQYYGLTNQLRQAANMFRAIITNSPNWYTPYILGNNRIYYNPGPCVATNSAGTCTQRNPAACGSSIVNIQNRATQALYNYTPYQPNQSALSAGWGTGDSCGAYGNRNFYLYFTEWFGSTTTLSTWTTVSQNAYYDESKRQSASMATLTKGDRYYLVVTLKNTGNITWTRNGPNPVNLGTSDQKDRSSPFCDTTWINSAPSCNRVASLHEYTVAPGQIGSFEFWITAPETGSYNELFAPVMEGVAWMGSGSISFPGIISPPYYSAAITGQYAYTDTTKQASIDIRGLIPGKKYYLGITLKNTGNITWTRNGPNPVNLGTSDQKDRSSPFCDTTWINSAPSCNRVASLHEYTVAPGQIGSFEFWITAPETGSYNEAYLPVMEGRSWLDTPNSIFSLHVQPYTWNQGNQTLYEDSSKAKVVDFNNLKPNTRYYFVSEIKNTGSIAWQKINNTPASLGTTAPRDHASALCDTTWSGCNRPALIHEYSISPGQTGSYEFWIKTPVSAGTFKEGFSPLIEGLNWMGTKSIEINYTTRN